MENNLTFIFLIDNIAGDQLFSGSNQKGLCVYSRMKVARHAS